MFSIAAVTEKDCYREIREQISWLHHETAKALSNLRIASSELDIIKKDVEDFVQEYYKQIGKHVEEIERINRQAGHTKEAEYIPENNIFIPEEIKQTREKEAKLLYKKLAKELHPDISNENTTELFSIINESYIKKDLSALVRIEQLFLDKNNTARTPIKELEYLENKYDTIMKAADKVKMQKHELFNSSEYKLYQQVRWHKMYGDDLILKIKNNMISQLQNEALHRT